VESAGLGIDTTINQNMAAIVPGKQVEPRFLHRYLMAAYDDLRLLGRGANQPALNCDILRSYRMPLPPLVEQHEIVAFIERMYTPTGRTMELAEDQRDLQRDLLQERRTALISAAVTGKIDVRNWQPPAGNARVSNQPAEHHPASGGHLRGGGAERGGNL
jgi:type I restriction enzyme, S subunit